MLRSVVGLPLIVPSSACGAELEPSRGSLLAGSAALQQCRKRGSSGGAGFHGGGNGGWGAWGVEVGGWG